MEIARTDNADQTKVDQIAEESKAGWWKENKRKFIQ